jgi:hypothetical protein
MKDHNETTKWPIGSCGRLPTDLQEAFDKATTLATTTSVIVDIAKRGVAGSHAMPPPGNGSYVSRLRSTRSLLAPVAAVREDRDASVRIFQSALESIKELLRNTEPMGDVTNELTIASEPAGRFGHANAHKACFSLGIDAWFAIWGTADPVTFYQATEAEAEVQLDPEKVRVNFREVCSSVAGREWPDFSQLRVACEIEACKAAAARMPPSDYVRVESQRQHQGK